MPELKWKCEGCTHFVMCSFRKNTSEFFSGESNLYNWIDTEANVKKARSAIYSLHEDCKHFLSEENPV